MSKPRLLIVDDDESTCTQLKRALLGEFALWFAGNRAQAWTVFRDVRPPLISLDLGLPPTADTGEEGLKLLDDVLRVAPTTKVIVVTGNGDREHALRAVQLGAFDYHRKPLDYGEFQVVLRRAVYLQALETETDRRAREIESIPQFTDILGNTPKIREVLTIVSRVAKSDATVLIQGESGTGKELIARAIHARSGRPQDRFVPINCGAIPESLLESELFGHERGAYTGAHIQRKGKFETADGGTLFLDEIGEMSPQLQVKLLRFLQEREIERLGSRERIRVDVRVTAATNKDLRTEIQAGRFRDDLYYRLSVINIKVPALRDRGEDVILLANAFRRRICQDRRRTLRFSEDALAAIARYSWPGNIRELENAVNRAVIMAQGRAIEPSDLTLEPAPSAPLPKLKEAKARAEREVLVDALIRTRGNITEAARALCVSRPTVHGLLNKHDVSAKQFR